MILGREFQLKVATIAIDSACVTVRLRGESVVKVISQSSDGKIVHVLSEGRQFAMFTTDILERGRQIENPAGASQAPAEIRAAPDLELIRKALQSEVEDAQQRRVAASEHFCEVMGQLPSGIPYSDATDRIQLASRKYSNALREAIVAMTRLNEFLVHGTIPPELVRKPPAIERQREAAKKAGQG